jgi:hypothetical protein
MVHDDVWNTGRNLRGVFVTKRTVWYEVGALVKGFLFKWLSCTGSQESDKEACPQGVLEVGFREGGQPVTATACMIPEKVDCPVPWDTQTQTSDWAAANLVISTT